MLADVEDSKLVDRHKNINQTLCHLGRWPLSRRPAASMLISSWAWEWVTAKRCFEFPLLHGWPAWKPWLSLHKALILPCGSSYGWSDSTYGEFSRTPHPSSPTSADAEICLRWAPKLCRQQSSFHSSLLNFPATPSSKSSVAVDIFDLQQERCFEGRGGVGVWGWCLGMCFVLLTILSPFQIWHAGNRNRNGMTTTMTRRFTDRGPLSPPPFHPQDKRVFKAPGQNIPRKKLLASSVARFRKSAKGHNAQTLCRYLISVA